LHKRLLSEFANRNLGFIETESGNDWTMRWGCGGRARPDHYGLGPADTVVGDEHRVRLDDEVEVARA